MARLFLENISIGYFPFPNVEEPFKSQAIGSYEEKVALFAAQEMRQRNFPKLTGDVHVGIHIRSRVEIEPVGVCKAILDALTGVAYKDDRKVKQLKVSTEEVADISQVQVEVQVSPLCEGRQVHPRLGFYVPGTPIEKGMAFSGRPWVRFEDPLPIGDSFLAIEWPRDTRSSNQSPALLTSQSAQTLQFGDPSKRYRLGRASIKVQTHSLHDIDNVLRYIIYHLIEAGYLSNNTRFNSYEVSLFGVPGTLDITLENLGFVEEQAS